MCLGIPGKVLETSVEQNVRMGKVDFGGVLRQICLEYTPDVALGNYVIVHAGFALQVIDEAEAGRIFALLKEMAEL